MGDMWFGHYRLQRLLGSGCTGKVWLARDTRTDRDVALKVFAAESAADPGYRQRFTREARLASQLRGPHTVAIHGFGELDGHLYLDMEYIEGIDGAELLRRQGSLSAAAAARIVSQAATALDAAHRIGLVHRDVKPSNLMVTPDGDVRLIDFGTATHTGQPALTATGEMVGTLGYVAPERFSGTADARSDQYSLTCVLYELLTGRRPFGDGESPRQMHAHLTEIPPAARDVVPAVPAALDAVIARGMAKNPDERWSSTSEFAVAACAAVTGGEVPAVEITPAPAFATIGAPRNDPQIGHPQHDPAVRNATPRFAATPGGTVFAPPPRRSTRSQAGPMRDRPRLALAAIAALAGVIGAALWIGSPGGAETESAAPTTRPGATTALPPPTAAPIGAPPRPAVPSAERPCDPAVYPTGFEDDGFTLHCKATGGGASWTRVLPQPATVVPPIGLPKVTDESGPGNGAGQANGQGKPGNGNGNGNNGNNGNGKPPKLNK